MPMPELTPVESSNIDAIGHDGTDLYVRFKSGPTWKYLGVPPDVHAALLADKSPGSFFARQIKTAYKGEKQ